jgi:hypothetical protein
MERGNNGSRVRGPGDKIYMAVPDETGCFTSWRLKLELELELERV